MQRTPNGPSRPQTNTANSEITAHKSNAAARAQQHDQVGTFWDMLAIRVVFTAICVAAGFHFPAVQRVEGSWRADGIFVRAGGDSV